MSLKEKLKKLVEKTALKESFTMEEYSEMSDSELAQCAEREGLEKLIVKDGEGGLANREEIIQALENLDNYEKDNKEMQEESLDEDTNNYDDKFFVWDNGGSESASGTMDRYTIILKDDMTNVDRNGKISVLISGDDPKGMSGHESVFATDIEKLLNAPKLEFKKDTFLGDQIPFSSLPDAVQQFAINYYADQLENSQEDINEENIDELDKKTLKSYVKKSLDVSGNDNSIANAAFRSGKKFSDNQHDDSEDDGTKDDRKAFKRSKFVSKAIDKLTEEDLNEDDKDDHDLNDSDLNDNENLDAELNDEDKNLAKDDSEDEEDKDELEKVTVVVVSPELKKDDEEDDELAGSYELDDQFTKEHVEALHNGETLSEEFKEKSKTIFEAALNLHAKNINESLTKKFKEKEVKLERKYKKDLNEAKANLIEEQAKLIDGYLSEAIDTWINENKIALESNIRTELTEEFIDRLKGLFTESYIEIPEDKFDLIKAQEEKIGHLEEALQQSQEKSLQYIKESKRLHCESVINKATADMTKLDKAKFIELLESVDFKTVDEFEKKVKTLKESYTKKSTITKKPLSEKKTTIQSDVRPIIKEEVLTPADIVADFLDKKLF